MNSQRAEAELEPQPERNTELISQVLAQILLHPDSHDQSDWIWDSPCGTTACVAGWAAIKAGRKLVATDPGRRQIGWVRATPEEINSGFVRARASIFDVIKRLDYVPKPEYVEALKQRSVDRTNPAYYDREYVYVLGVGRAAAIDMGITQSLANDLFSPTTSRDDIIHALALLIIGAPEREVINAITTSML